MQHSISPIEPLPDSTSYKSSTPLVFQQSSDVIQSGDVYDVIMLN